MSRASLLALDLHERRCIGVVNGYCERGGRHARTFIPLAKEALAAPDPACLTPYQLDLFTEGDAS